LSFDFLILKGLEEREKDSSFNLGGEEDSKSQNPTLITIFRSEFFALWLAVAWSQPDFWG